MATRPRPRPRVLLAGATAGAVAATLVTGAVLADRGSTPGAEVPPPTLRSVAFHGELPAAASCADLLEHYVDRAVDLVGEFGWSVVPYGSVGSTALEEAAIDLVPQATGDRARPAAPRTTRATASGTGTNVQEAGVDEPDAVKTRGGLLVRLRGAELTTYDVGGARVRELGSLDLGDLHDGELLLTGDTVVVVGVDGSRSGRDPWTGAPLPAQQTRVLTVDVAAPAAPVVRRTVDYDAALVAARQHGSVVRLVLDAGLPDLAFDLDGDPGAERVNRRLVERSTLEDWLPRVAVDGGAPQELLPCDRVALPRADLVPTTTAVVAFDAADAGAPAPTDALGLAGAAPMTYESADHLYLAASPAPVSGCWECWPLEPTTATVPIDGGTTHLYGFALDGPAATYVGAGEVEGHLRDRWSMDEAGGVLRLAVGPSSETADENAVVTLRPEGDELVEVGRVGGLGVEEDIKSVRWSDGLALLVTFREVDPLYAVDLTRPAAPRLLGELKIPGFSSYLHPLGPRRVVGTGDDGTGRAQAGLFDLTDPTDPQRLDVVTYVRGTRALAGDDPRQFTWLPEERIVLTVVDRRGTGYVSTLRLGGGRMRGAVTEVEYGDDVAQVRLVPVAGPEEGPSRVVLVTGEDVRFWDLGSAAPQA